MMEILPVFGLILVTIMAAPVVVKMVLARRFRQAPRSNEAVYLTFDDGPSPETTPLVLEHLAAAQARATFFVVGKKVRQHPWLVAELLNQGHEVGSHGFAHLHPWRVSPLASLRDLQAGIADLAEQGVSRSEYFRPPFGKFGPLTALWVLATGKQPAFWSIDPRDYAADTAEEVVRRVMARVRGGSVILLHDGFNPGGRNPELIAETVRMLLAELTARGFRFSTLGDIWQPGRIA